jgi:hypothetical protein
MTKSMTVFSRIGGMTCGFLRGFLDERRRGLIGSGMAEGRVDERVNEVLRESSSGVTKQR